MDPLQVNESMVYPVISRRSGGLSLGIDLFAGKKLCNFHCPYCDISADCDAANATNKVSHTPSLDRLSFELDSFIESKHWRMANSLPLMDVCFAGSGEPTLSPLFPEAVRLVHRWLHNLIAREASQAKIARHAGLNSTLPAKPFTPKLLLITNSTCFCNSEKSSFLNECVHTLDLHIWAKLDAGDNEAFRFMSGSGFDVGEIIDSIARFAQKAPLSIQTMLCKLESKIPQERLQPSEDTQKIARAKEHPARMHPAVMCSAGNIAARDKHWGITGSFADSAFAHAMRPEPGHEHRLIADVAAQAAQHGVEAPDAASCTYTSALPGTSHGRAATGAMNARTNDAGAAGIREERAREERAREERAREERAREERAREERAHEGHAHPAGGQAAFARGVNLVDPDQIAFDSAGKNPGMHENLINARAENTKAEFVHADYLENLARAYAYIENAQGHIEEVQLVDCVRNNFEGKNLAIGADALEYAAFYLAQRIKTPIRIFGNQ